MNATGQPHKHALVIDDDELMRLMLGEALLPIGFSVTEAASGEAGLAAYARLKPDLVLLDLLMPGIDGLEVCRRLRARPDGAHVPIVMITGQDDRESVEQAYAAGATDFIIKPILWAMLPHRLRFIMQAADSLHRYAQSEARMQQAQRLAGLGSFEYFPVTRRFYPSANLPALLGVHGDANTRLRDLKSAFLPEEWARLIALTEGARELGESQTIETQNLLGQRFRFHVEATSVDGAPLLRGTFLDVTDLRSAQAHAVFLERHDPTTGLHNLKAFATILAHEAAQAARHQHNVPVLLIGLDRMRRVRDSYGHGAADVMMYEVVTRLNEACASLDPAPELARITTDEIAVILRHDTREDGIVETAEKLLAALSERFEVDGQHFHLQPAGGLVRYPKDGASCEAVLKAARAALTMEGNEARALHFYDAQSDAALTRRIQLEEDLREALTKGQLQLYYQPLIRVSDQRPVGVEALLRWHHPERGLVSPVEFIPIAEESGLMHEIGAWVVHEACAQAMRWRTAGIMLAEIAINVSGRQLADPGFTARVAAALAASGLAPGRLVLELTESVLVHDNEAALKQLGALKELGLRLALDDFGTGFSSLVSLTRLPLDVLKIDKSFVQAAPTQRSAAAVVEAILALAGRLGMETVAEGVEESEHFDFLLNLGCTTAQGFMFRKPQPAGELASYLGQGHAARPLKIMIVDDSRLSRMMLAHFIGARLPTATLIEIEDATLVSAAVAREQPDLVTLDINMPKMNGMEVAAVLRAEYPGLDIAMLTANFQDSVVAEAGRLGLRFFAKPITAELVDAVLAPYEAHA